jgi:hypothetical protein
MSFTIQDLHNYAKQNNGECLTETYSRCDKLFEWKCSAGHVWKTSWSNIKRDGGKWCQTCRVTGLKDLQEFAEKKGGKCHSEKYNNTKTNYLWECENDHTWKATWLNVRYNGTWCKTCALGIWDFQKIRDFTLEKGGDCMKCLSGIGLSGRYIWKCQEGHMWETNGSNVVHNGTWCAECKKLTIEEMKKLAEERGGKCLSDIYVNKRTKLVWQCGQGHIWKARPGGVKNNGIWCAVCQSNERKLTVQYAQELAKERNGKCLSQEYINDFTHLHWECENGHKWFSSINTVQRGSWCRKCHLRERRNTAIDNIVAYVSTLGGKMISDMEKVKNNDALLNSQTARFMCHKSHTWDNTLENLRNGVWCPECRYKSETMCKKFFEEYMDYKFPKRRLKCMEYLELDGYCDEVKLAFEYNGLQHYKFIPFFHRNGIIDLEKQNERDERKKRLCQENDIHLIIIPSKYSYLKPRELRRFIYDSLLQSKFLLEIILKK